MAYENNVQHYTDDVLSKKKRTREITEFCLTNTNERTFKNQNNTVLPNDHSRND